MDMYNSIIAEFIDMESNDFVKMSRENAGMTRYTAFFRKALTKEVTAGGN